MTVTSRLVASTATVANTYGLVPQTVVALPPSDLDLAEDEMRVYLGGVLTTRHFDPTFETDGPVTTVPASVILVTESGARLVTESGASIALEG